MAAEQKYQIIPRKYRPQTFSQVVGQDAIVTTLKNALLMKRLAHAYLFCGSRGTGKTTLARLFAKALNCRQLSDAQEPCNECPSCLEIASGRSLDVLEIDGASSRGIDDIRQINETIGYAPASGKYKIYIIDEVHMLTKEAFNALLKTLEEPPVNVKFFFATTEPHKVLPTIVSRCQRFDLSRISSDIMLQKLSSIAKDMQVEIEDEALSLLTQASEGSLRDAESLLDQIICYAKSPISAEEVAAALGLMPQATFFALDQAIHTSDLSFAFRLSNDIFAAGKDISYFLESLLEHFRTLLLFILKTPPSFTEKEKERYLSSAALYTEEQCLYILDFLIHWVQQIGKTPFKRISLEMILLHLIRSKYRVPVASLVKRLIELENAIGEEPVQKEPIKETPIIEEKLEIKPQMQEPIVEQRPPKLTEILAPPQPSTLLSALSEKISAIESLPTFTEVAPPTESKPEPLKANEPKENAPSTLKKEPPVQEKKSGSNAKEQSKIDTLIRFAAVELEGIVKTE